MRVYSENVFDWATCRLESCRPHEHDGPVLECKSSSRTQNEQHSSTDVRNVNLQDTEGVTIADSSGVNVTLTDSGAVQAALDVGLEALATGGDAFETAAGLAGRGLDNAMSTSRAAIDAVSLAGRDTVREIADFGGTAIGEVRMVSQDAMDTVLEAGGGVLDFASDIFSTALSAQKDLTGSNLSGLTALARQTSESADDRVTRTAMYAFLAMAAVFVIPAIFRRAAA